MRFSFWWFRFVFAKLFESVTLCVSLNWWVFSHYFFWHIYIYIDNFCSIISLFSFESSHKSLKCCSFLVPANPPPHFLFFISIELTSNSWNLSCKIFILLLITSGELLVLNIIFCSSIIYFRFFFIVSIFLLRSSVNRSRFSFIVLNILIIAALVLFQHLLIELISIHCLFCTEWLGFPVSSYVRSFWIVSCTLWMTCHWDSVPIICSAKEFHIFLYRLLTWLNSYWRFFFFPCSCLFSLARAACCLRSACIWITQGSARNVECIYRSSIYRTPFLWLFPF